MWIAIRNQLFPQGSRRRVAARKAYRQGVGTLNSFLRAIHCEDLCLKNKVYNTPLDLSTKNSLSAIVNQIPRGSTVLEFGPANGRLTRHLKEELNCAVYAVELDADAAMDARSFTREMIVGDIEAFTWEQAFRGIKFDYILFADVLEHLRQPEEVLKRAIDFLNDKGKFLISLPNIAHNSIIIELFNDRFTYHSTGLLDNTHIKFFTNSSFLDLLERLQLSVVLQTPIVMPPRGTEFMNGYGDVPKELATLLRQRPTGEFYQYVYEVQKRQ